jgi:UDP-N-acetylmuramoyl-tripeptide--D-alanyl-D-alanine ligase
VKGRLSEAAGVAGGRLEGRDAEFAGVSTDSRSIERGMLFVALRGERFDGHEFVAGAAGRGAAGAVVSRAIDAPLPQVVVGDTLAALAAIAADWRARSGALVLGVGGSNGKTTTKEMLAAILAGAGATLATRGNLNNHIGVPLTLLRLEPGHRFAVIEMGANHPGEIAALAALAKPSIALVTNAGDEHLEGFGDLEGVARAEGEMYAALGTGGIAIVNADDTFAALWESMAPPGADILRFGIDARADVRAASIQGRIEAGAFATTFTLAIGKEEARVRIGLAGRHNVANALGRRSRGTCRRRRHPRHRGRPRPHEAGRGPPAAEARAARLLADRRLVQREPEFGSGRNRRAVCTARRALAGARGDGGARRRD